MRDEGVVWIGEKPTLKLDRHGLEFTLRSESHAVTFRMPQELAFETASDVLFLRDQQNRRPSNVMPFKKR